MPLAHGPDSKFIISTTWKFESLFGQLSLTTKSGFVENEGGLTDS